MLKRCLRKTHHFTKLLYQSYFIKLFLLLFLQSKNHIVYVICLSALFTYHYGRHFPVSSFIIIIFAKAYVIILLALT